MKEFIEIKPTRNNEQSMGIWIKEPMLREPEQIERAVDTLPDSGFGIVRLFLINSNFTHLSPEIVAIVGKDMGRSPMAENQGVAGLEINCDNRRTSRSAGEGGKMVIIS